MFISKEELEKRLDSENNAINSGSFHPAKTRLGSAEKELESGPIRENMGQVRPINNGGRRNGDKNVPFFIREIVGTLANSEPTKQLAQEFGLSKSSVDQYKVGKTSAHCPDAELKKKIEENLGKARDVAMDRLMVSLGLLTEEKISKGSAKDISTIAKNMSSVVEKTTPQLRNTSTNVQLVIYSPRQKDEAEFETVILPD